MVRCDAWNLKSGGEKKISCRQHAKHEKRKSAEPAPLRVQSQFNEYPFLTRSDGSANLIILQMLLSNIVVVFTEKG